MTDLRFAGLDTTDPARARAIGLAQATGAHTTIARAHGQANAHERALQAASDLLDACHAHAATLKRARGEYVGGQAPYGLALGPDGLVDVPHEAEACALALALADAGRPLRAIGTELARRGLLPRSGKAWHPMTLSRVIGAARARQDYASASDVTGAVTPF